MELEFVAFYPYRKLERGFKGQAHVYIKDWDVDLRGLGVLYDTAKEVNPIIINDPRPFAINSENTLDNVDITAFCIRTKEVREAFRRQLKEVIWNALVLKYGLKDGKLDYSTMKFMEEEFISNDLLVKKFKLYKTMCWDRKLDVRSDKAKEKYGNKPFSKPPGQQRPTFGQPRPTFGKPAVYQNREFNYSGRAR